MGPREALWQPLGIQLLTLGSIVDLRRAENVVTHDDFHCRRCEWLVKDVQFAQRDTVMGPGVAVWQLWGLQLRTFGCILKPLGNHF